MVSFLQPGPLTLIAPVHSSQLESAAMSVRVHHRQESNGLRLPPTLAIALLALVAPMLAAQGTPDCFTGSPARPVNALGPSNELIFPRSTAGDLILQPADAPGLAFPSSRDSTGFNGQQLPSVVTGLELFTAVDIEESDSTPYIYVAYTVGFQIWDLSDPSLPSNSALLSQRDGFRGDFHSFEPPGEHSYLKIFDIDALDAPDHQAVIAVPAIEPVGFSLWNVDNKTAPVQIYQDIGKPAESVALGLIDGTVYAFLATTGPSGIDVYDVSRAQALGTCFEDTASGGSLCSPGDPVHLGALARPTSTNRTLHLDLMKRAADGQHYLAYSDGYLFNPLGVEVRRINDPSDPGNLDGDGLDNPILISLLGPRVSGVDLFEHESNSYLAAVHDEGGSTYIDVYDINACLNGTSAACAAPPRIYRREVLDAMVQRPLVSAFHLDLTPMLYVGSWVLCSSPAPVGQPKRDALINLTGLPGAVPQDGSELVVGESYTETVGTETLEIDYWTSYYDGVTPGLSGFSATKAAANGGYLYRAGGTILDIHQWSSPMPSDAIFADGFESGSTSEWQ